MNLARWRSKLSSSRIRRHGRTGALALGFVLVAIAPASAQYAFDPPPQPTTGMLRYFGTAKDENGRPLPDVTVVLRRGVASFIFITDHDGRFVDTVPDDMTYAATQAQCSKAGYELVRVDKRPGPRAVLVVQVDCKMRRLPKKE